MRRGLSDPVRLRILEALWEGPRTAKALGAALGTVPNRLYYHLRAMEAAGLITVVGAEVAGRFAERVYGAAFLHLGNDFAGARSEERSALFEAMFKLTAQELGAVDRNGGNVQGITRGVLRTTPARLTALVEGLESLVQEAWEASGDPDAVDYRFATAFYESAALVIEPPMDLGADEGYDSAKPPSRHGGSTRRR